MGWNGGGGRLRFSQQRHCRVRGLPGPGWRMRQKMPSPPGYHSIIETYGALFENLRKFVSINITSNCARDKLQKTRQSFNESVHGYVKRFRHSFNEHMYALQHEIRDPIRQAVAIDLENERSY